MYVYTYSETLCPIDCRKCMIAILLLFDSPHLKISCVRWYLVFFNLPDLEIGYYVLDLPIALSLVARNG